MAELATIARPYAEALFKAIGWQPTTPGATGGAGCRGRRQAVAGNEPVAASSPPARRPSPTQVADAGDLGRDQDRTGRRRKISNLLRTACIENGRLVALPEIAAPVPGAGQQLSSGVSDASIGVQRLRDRPGAAGRHRGGRWRSASVASSRPSVKVVDASLIGGIRVVVGDEVLDTSVARPSGTNESGADCIKQRFALCA
jgi:F-type H+-transporting ATPase subunit delta